MKHFRKNYLVSTAVLLSVATIAMAHEGGYHNTTTTPKHWQFMDHHSVEGWFLLAKDDTVYIENTLHEVVSFSIASLSKEDASFVRAKQQDIAMRNTAPTQAPEHVSLATTHTPKYLSLATTHKVEYFSRFSPSSYGFLFLLVLALGAIAHKKMQHRIFRTLYGVAGVAVFILLVNACTSSSDLGSSTDDGTDGDTSTEEETEGDITGQSPTDPEVIKEAFALYPKVTTDSDDDYFYVVSDGLAEHEMMVGITAWIAQVPIPQAYTNDSKWAIPLNAQYAESPVSLTGNFQRGAVAIAANGIPIFNPVNASGDISGEIGELDAFGGHSGRADDYHYHTAPLHLESTSGTKPIAYAFDGFAMYGTTEADGSSMDALDEYQGHVGSDGIYHYHGTATYPYIMTSMRGQIELEGTAPFNQITPQASAEALRQGDPHPINGDNLIITAMTADDDGHGFLLEYTIDGVAGSVDYSWTDAGVFTYIFNDVDGSSTTEPFTRDVGTDSTDSFEVTSDAIQNDLLSDDYKCEMKDSDLVENSIPLKWVNVPEGTGSLAVIMHHFPNPDDTTMANQYLLLWGIDPSVTEMPYGTADDGPWYMGSDKDGTAISYTSPCSPDPATHEYTITVYALSETPSSLPTESSIDVTYDVLLDAIDTVSSIGKAELTFDSVTE